MYIQPCASKNGAKFVTLNFSGEKSNDYSSYMANKSNDIIATSAIGGTCVGLISAKSNFKREVLPKIAHNIGLATLILFGIISLNFFLSDSNNTKKENL